MRPVFGQYTFDGDFRTKLAWRGTMEIIFTNVFVAAIDLVDEAVAKLKIEITSKPTELDEIDRAILKMEMEKPSFKND
ncbi:hypothetical protein AgCh_000413 [Apium graveolens]